MNDFLKMDIFFVVATLVTLLIGGLLGLAIYKVIKILETVRKITDLVQEEVLETKQDLRELRGFIREKNFTFSKVISFLKRYGKRIVRRMPF